MPGESLARLGEPVQWTWLDVDWMFEEFTILRPGSIGTPWSLRAP